MLDKIVIGGVLLACLGGLHYVDKHYAVKEAIVVTTARMNASYNAQLIAYNKAAKDKQEAMQEKADATRDEKDAKINSITVERDNAVSELRKRPKRPTSTDSAQGGTDSKACTARELYQEDAEFLTREAARAETVMVERDYYYNQYEAVRNTINGLTK